VIGTTYGDDHVDGIVMVPVTETWILVVTMLVVGSGTIAAAGTVDGTTVAGTTTTPGDPGTVTHAVKVLGSTLCWTKTGLDQ
jgi:hypothetical protein